MFPLRCELGSYIPEDAIHHSHRSENLKSYLLKYLATSRVPHFYSLSFELMRELDIRVMNFMEQGMEE
jgi:hypothetical protein